MKIEIIYSDNDLIVINKPPGIPTHGGIGIGRPTVSGFLLEKFPELKNVGEESDRPVHYLDERPGIVHRLDKDTSGVMVVARNQQSFNRLKELFQKRLVDKTYLAIVCGRPRKKEGTIDLPLGRLVKNPLKRGAKDGRSAIRGERNAITEYKVLKSGEKYSLLELRPKTGRMHQLRVHLKAMGYPVACDTLYGGKKVCCPEGSKRQLLHAQSLSFSFPEGKRFYFESEVPSDFPKDYTP